MVLPANPVSPTRRDVRGRPRNTDTHDPQVTDRGSGCGCDPSPTGQLGRTDRIHLRPRSRRPHQDLASIIPLQRVAPRGPTIDDMTVIGEQVPAGLGQHQHVSTQGVQPLGHAAPWLGALVLPTDIPGCDPHRHRGAGYGARLPRSAQWGGRTALLLVDLQSCGCGLRPGSGLTRRRRSSDGGVHPELEPFDVEDARE